jgi:SWIM zinc finger
VDSTKSSASPAHPSTREQRGLELYRRGGIERIARDLYIVPSRTRRGAEYLVDLAAAAPRCECADHKRHGGPCLHAYAALIYRAHLRRAARVIAPVLADAAE